MACEVSVSMMPIRKSAATAGIVQRNKISVSFTSGIVHCVGDSRPRGLHRRIASSIFKMDLATPLTYIKGVGPARAAMLEAKGLRTVEDLLAYVPFRYEDRSNVKAVNEL